MPAGLVFVLILLIGLLNWFQGSAAAEKRILGGFTCTASERANTTEPPEYVCIKYERKEKP